MTASRKTFVECRGLPSAGISLSRCPVPTDDAHSRPSWGVNRTMRFPAQGRSWADDSHLKVLRLLEATPAINQRHLAEALGVSLGKANFCRRALLDKGLVKAENFRNNQNKLSYAYLFTPSGVAEKAALTTRFLQRKTREYEILRAELELLQREVDELCCANPTLRGVSGSLQADRINP